MLLTLLVQVKIAHAAPQAAVGSITFDSIPAQPMYVPFLVGVTVRDARGQPVRGANVTVQLLSNPPGGKTAYVRTPSHLADAAGRLTTALQGITDGDGRATLWVRLSNKTSPFDIALTASVTLGGVGVGSATSDVFRVYDITQFSPP